MALKPWNKLPVGVRRSRQRLYEYIRTDGKSEEKSTTSEVVEDLDDAVDDEF